MESSARCLHFFLFDYIDRDEWKMKWKRDLTHAAVNKHRNRIQTKLTKISRKERKKMMKSRDCLSFDLNHLNWIWNCLKRKTSFLQVSMISSTTAHRSSDKLPQASRESFSLQQSLRSLVCLCVALPVDDDNERGDLWLWRWDFNNVYLSTIESSIHCWSPSKVSDDDFHQKTDFNSVCSFLKHLKSGSCRKCDEIFAEISRNFCSDSPTLVSDSEFPSNESWACVSAAVTWLTSSQRRQFTRMFAMDPDCSLEMRCCDSN